MYIIIILHNVFASRKTEEIIDSLSVRRQFEVGGETDGFSLSEEIS